MTYRLINKLNKRAKRKKMRSTHACTPSFATFHRNIHVGCCLFSHNNLPTKTKLKSTILPPRFVTKFCFLLATILFYSTNLIKRAKRKKNAEHTHMYTIFHYYFFSIFTSVVVYSRTTQIFHEKQNI